MKNQKQILREQIAGFKKSLSDDIVAGRSRLICNRLVQTGLFQQAKCIALYYEIGKEVKTSGLIEAWRSEKQIVLPVVSGENIHFCPYTGKENMHKGMLGVVEPVSREVIPPENIDIFIVPGIAFDYSCNRLGRGKGYYDRYLSGIDKPIIGLCFDFQLVKNIPCEVHDIKMTMIISENTIVSSHHQ